MYVPGRVDAVVLKVSIEVPEALGVRPTLAGLKAAMAPVALGDTPAVRATDPVKPRLFRVIVDVTELPATILAGLAALAAIVKSDVTVMVTIAV